MPTAILARGISKHYADLAAVSDLNLDIGQGEFFGLLGPNGAGKTTTLHMLTTLAAADTGEVEICGLHAQRQSTAVRARIGLVFQESALDRNLSVWENLMFAAALYDLPHAQAKAQATELLQLFNLKSRRDSLVGQLSGGMRRSLDIARGVLHRPQVLFLDEPTIGLDLVNRRAIWEFLGRLRRHEGMTLLLTTHYLEEAGACDRIAFLRHGKLTQQGVPAELIAQLGSYILEIESTRMEEHARLLQPDFGAPLCEGQRLSFRIAHWSDALERRQRQLQNETIRWQLRRPDLNDVYLWHNQTPEATQA